MLSTLVQMLLVEEFLRSAALHRQTETESLSSPTTHPVMYSSQALRTQVLPAVYPHPIEPGLTLQVPRP